MSGYTFSKSGNDDGPRNQRLGNIVLVVTDFDKEQNAIEGYRPGDGEVMKVRLADKEEFADLYVNRDKHTTEAQRMAVSGRQTRNRPGVDDIEAKVQADAGVIQLQSVVKKEDGELVARWMESLTTTPEDSYVNGMVSIAIPRSNEETKGEIERRKAEVIMLDQATNATRETLDSFTSNQITGTEGRTQEGRVRSAVLVAAETVADPGDPRAAILWTPFNRDTKDFEDGTDKLLSQPLNRHNWQATVALAAQVDFPFENLQWDTNSRNKVSNPNYREDAQQLYNATKEGAVKVAVAPGFFADMMPRITEHVVDLEQKAIENEGRSAKMSGRGFFNADVSFRSRPGNEQYGAQTSIKQVLPNEFLHPESSQNYSVRKRSDIAAEAMAIAERNAGMDLTAGASKEAAGPAVDQQAGRDMEQERDHEQERNVSMSPSMDM